MQNHNPTSVRVPPRAAPAAPPVPAGGGFLGTTAKLQATRKHGASSPVGSSGVDPDTGEISGIRDPAHCRVERYALQSVVRSLLPNSRTAKCLRHVQANRETVDVWCSTEYQRAHYGGLQTCGSVWACPVCAAKISERRRAELQALIAGHELAGGVVLLVTRTVPHERYDNLEELLDKIAAAEISYKAHRDYKALCKVAGLVGRVRAVEVTYGHSNGWHPHVHELLFLARAVDLEALEDGLSSIWARAALRSGLREPSRAHGVTVQDGSQAAKYASKWGLESELTQWHRKRGKVGSRTPFDLLRSVLLDHDWQAAELFRQYADAFHGRHQLQFSAGLKRRYKIADLSDSDLVNRQDSDAVLLGSLDLEQWRLVCRANQRGSLLEVAAAMGWPGVVELLAGLRRSFGSPSPGD